MRRILDEIRHRLWVLLDRRRANSELEEELEHHIAMETEALMRESGLDRDAARRQAALAFGGLGAVREATREQRGTLPLEDLARDLRLGTRTLARSPRFTAAALLSLVLGVGATITIFAVVDAVLLRPLPYEHLDRLVELSEITPEGDLFSTSDLNLLDFRARTTTLDGIAAVAFPSQNLLLDGDEPVRLRAVPVTDDFFALLGVRPERGRTWEPGEVPPGNDARSVVLAHQTWQRHFGGDPGLVGDTVRLGAERWTVLGVLPPEFRFGESADLWIPYPIDIERERGDHRLSAYARLAPGVDIASAERELRDVITRLGEQYPETVGGWDARLRPLAEVALGPEARATTLALLVAVVLLLLLACANVSSLLLARGATRGDEMAMRRALGAGRWRLVRQLLAESSVLGVVGAAGGLLLAAIALPLVRSLGSGALPRIEDAALDVRGAAFTIAVAISASLLFGAAPALQLSATAPRQWAGGGLRSGSGVRSTRLRSTLVVAQLAAALVLTSSSLLLFDSFSALRRVPSGIDLDGLVAADVSLPMDRYGEGSEQVRLFYDRVLEEVRSTPGLEAAGATTTHPFRGPSLANTVARPEATERAEFVEIAWRSVRPGTFRALGMPLLRGRDFIADEKELVTILSASLAERLYPGEDPIGRQVRWIRPEGPLARVVGVVADVRDLDVATEPRPTYYWNQHHMGWPDLTVVARGTLPGDQLVRALSEAVRRADPLLPPPETSLVEDDLSRSMASPRLSLQVFALFAGAALATALIGLYGLVAFTAASRRGELGLRVALGARPGDVRRVLLSQGVRLLFVGLGLGLVGVLAISRLLRELLFDTAVLEPRVLLLASSLFALATLLACLLPALRAARQDPVAALRSE
ncbi:MAG: hypothetical protein DWQ36_14855 [Acidobacteria bacterium]|nr:MAG: hypothetical protein DWQ30_10685 [Acidobacteriota bacterium]REK06171.1 MAG: hypothetical protein DWQ36_14855 [Acidobacteriota bacterium]